MVQILAEPGYSNSVWCRKLLDGLISELKQKHIDSNLAFFSLAAIASHFVDENEAEKGAGSQQKSESSPIIYLLC